MLAALALPLSAQTGPMVGTVKTTEAHFLYRPGAVEKPLRLTVLDANQQVVATRESASDDANDYVAKFHVTGLQAATDYTYRVEDLSGGSPVQVAGPADGLRFRTRTAAGMKGVVTAAFVSCANASSEPVWERLGALRPDLLVLGGDTPYVDVEDLATSRAKHRAFLETPFMQALVRGTPVAGTWDDHDFGLNNGNGVSAADFKANTRQAFVEYRAHDRFGTGTEGVYHKTDLGVMELFLLDPRWWSQTEASPVDASKKTCFGPAQWQWIRESLEASRAPFKVLVMGQIWQDKKNGETDDMFTYWYERDALLDFIRAKQIPGVVLVGGDIHVSRHLVHPRRTGYDLQDFIISPAHTSLIPSLDVPHPDLEWSSLQPRQFLTLTADTRVSPPLLTARFQRADGTVQREVAVPYDRLTPAEGEGLGEGLRAWWDFEGNTGNRTVLGTRVDAVAENGAALVADGGLRGGAAQFNRAAQQYLRVPRSALDDQSAGHTLSLWCRPQSLPAHGSADRHFLVESTLGGEVGSGGAYNLSLGFRAGDTPEQVNVQLFTHTLQPAASTAAAPVAIAQGPFDCMLDRALFTDRWAHVVVTFDSQRLKLHVDGTEVASHDLPVPGPASEMGGLVIGGHREGTGRNYDGLLDEIALWQRVLGAAEITALHHAGTPTALPVEVAAADRDGDTLEDWYEALHGLDPDDAGDAVADGDADGVPAYLERIGGTHPGIDDSGIYDYLRALACPGEETAALLFRHPGDGLMRLRLDAETSETLFDWSPRPSGSAAEAGITAGELGITVPGDDFLLRFFRVNASP
jgi:hypothetical protein